MKNELIKKLQEIVKELTQEDVQIEINRSNDSSHGDFATNIALKAFGTYKTDPSGVYRSRNIPVLASNPMDMAEKIVAAFGSFEGIEKVEAVRPGFINFYLSSAYLTQKMKELVKEEFDFANLGKDRLAIVEYSSPNIAKPFTIGHLRSTIIGDAIANVLQAVGYTVYRDNHLGDWGSQFGKQIYAIKTWGNEEEIENSPDPIKDLVALYIKFHEEAEKNPDIEEEGRKWFKKLEDGDEEARRLWKKCIDWSFKEFDRIYGELGVPSAPGKAFENNGRGYGESFFEDKMGSVIEELEEKKLLTEGKEGAKIVNFPDQTGLPPLMIIKKDGATLYATRDLATDKFRKEQYPGIELIINEVGAEQSLYFKQLYLLEEMLGWYKKGQRVHVGHGLFRFKEGKMSTRKGNVIWLQEVLEEAIERAKKLGSVDEATAKQVAMGALKWNDLKRSAHLDVAFDWDEVLNMQGNSGPYIQYSYVRTKSILEKAGNVGGLEVGNYQPNAEELEVLRQLDKFVEVVEQAAVTYSPNVVAQYLFELSQLFNNFYQKHRIVNAPTEEEKNFRLGLTAAVGNVLQKGLNLLGIVAPESM